MTGEDELKIRNDLFEYLCNKFKGRETVEKNKIGFNVISKEEIESAISAFIKDKVEIYKNSFNVIVYFNDGIVTYRIQLNEGLSNGTTSSQA